MSGEPPHDAMNHFVNRLLGLNPGQFGQDGQMTVDAPEHWLSQDVQLRNNQRSVEGTIPSFICDQVGIDKQDPPKVTVYFDPHTGVAVFDVAEHFGGAADG